MAGWGLGQGSRQERWQLERAHGGNVARGPGAGECVCERENCFYNRFSIAKLSSPFMITHPSSEVFLYRFLIEIKRSFKCLRLQSRKMQSSIGVFSLKFMAKLLQGPPAVPEAPGGACPRGSPPPGPSSPPRPYSRDEVLPGECGRSWRAALGNFTL